MAKFYKLTPKALTPDNPSTNPDLVHWPITLSCLWAELGQDLPNLPFTLMGEIIGTQYNAFTYDVGKNTHTVAIPRTCVEMIESTND